MDADGRQKGVVNKVWTMLAKDNDSKLNLDEPFVDTITDGVLKNEANFKTHEIGSTKPMLVRLLSRDSF